MGLRFSASTITRGSILQGSHNFKAQHSQGKWVLPAWTGACASHRLRSSAPTTARHSILQTKPQLWRMARAPCLKRHGALGSTLGSQEAFCLTASTCTCGATSCRRSKSSGVGPPLGILVHLLLSYAGHPHRVPGSNVVLSLQDGAPYDGRWGQAQSLCPEQLLLKQESVL